jgi:hypothetical protein
MNSIKKQFRGRRASNGWKSNGGVVGKNLLDKPSTFCPVVYYYLVFTWAVPL